jgi:hypothetical protein
MPRYIVKKNELWTQRVQIDADNPDDARLRVRYGRGLNLEDAGYQHNYKSNEWDVEEDKED